jgi:hypothetical protein
VPTAREQGLDFEVMDISTVGHSGPDHAAP